MDVEGRRWLGYYRGNKLDEALAPGDCHPLVEQARATAIKCTQAAPPALSGMVSERGFPRVLDFEDAAPEAITKLAWLADHVVFSAHGLSGFTGVAEPDAGLSIARERLGQVVLGVTLGPQGSMRLTDEGMWTMTAPPIRAQGIPPGAETFSMGPMPFLWREGLVFKARQRSATAAAAIKAQKGEGWLGMPTR